jgi:hypothetical protein
LVINVGGLRIASRLLDETRQQLGLQRGEVSTILKAVFKVTKTTKKEPNKAEVAIFNLKKENRIALQERKQPTTIEAGYLDNISQIFSGDLEFGENKKDGRHWITTLQAGDGSQKYKTSRINTSLKGPAQVGDVLKTAADAMGINPGNLQDAVGAGSLRGSLKEFTNGIVLSGKAELNVDKIAKSMGLRWSIQDGGFLFLGPDDFIGEQATVLAPGTGLIGSPEPGEDGIVKARSLLQPNLLPGHRVQIQSAEVDGFFRIEKAVFTGDTRGGDWYTDVECKPL